MGYIWWFIKAVFKLVLLAAVIVTAIFYYQKNDKATVAFNDGSEFSITAQSNWESRTDQFIEWASRHFIVLISPDHKLMFDQNTALDKGGQYVQIIANNFAVGRACFHPISGGKKFTDIVMPAGNVFYCNMPRKDNSGYDIDFFYPVAADKFAAVIIDHQIYQQHSNEIYTMLKTATYTPKR